MFVLRSWVDFGLHSINQERYKHVIQTNFSSAIVWTTDFDICFILTFLKLLLWSILISFSKTFFPKILVAYPPVFMVLNFEHHTRVFHLDLYQPCTMVTYKNSTFQHFPEILLQKLKNIKHPYGYSWSCLTQLYQNYHLWTEQDYRNHFFLIYSNAFCWSQLAGLIPATCVK